MRLTCFLCFLGVVVPCGVAAQEDAVTPVLGRLPAETAEARSALEADLAALNDAQLADLCGRVNRGGGGADAQARLAVHALIRLAGQTDGGPLRARVERALLRRLTEDAPAEVKDFFLEQLRFIATAQSVETVSTLLDEEALIERAAMVLTTVGGEASVRALRGAMTTATGKARVCLLHALAALEDGQSAADAVATADPADVALWRTLLWSLSASGSPVMEGLLEMMLAAPSSAGGASWHQQSYERDLALSFVERTSGGADAADRAARLRGILSGSSPADDVHLRCAALKTLVRVMQGEATGDALAALASDEIELAAAAEATLIELRAEGVGARLCEALSGASPSRQARLLDLLARRNESAVLPTCVEFLTASDESVRIAAARACLALGGEDAVASVIPVLESATPEGRSRLEAQLFALRADGAEAALVTALKASTSSAVRASLLEVLGRREAGGAVDAALSAAEDADAQVRSAAFRALERVGTCASADRVLARLVHSESAEDRDGAAAALAACVRRCEDATSEVRRLISAVQEQPPSGAAAMLRALAVIGNAEGLPAVRDRLDDAAPEVRRAAFEALCDWPDEGALGDLLRLARLSTDAADHVRAMRGALRILAEREAMPADARLDGYEQVLQSARRPDEKRQAFTGVSRITTPRALTLLEPHRMDPQAGSEAAMAIAQLCDRLIPAHCAEARRSLDGLTGIELPDAVREALQATIAKLNRFEDHITDWHVSGPYMQPGRRGQELGDVVFPPEDPASRGVIWREPAPGAPPQSAWAVDLGASPWLAGDMRAAYLHTRVYSPTTQEVRLELGSDDGIKAWLNGAGVHANNVLRGCAPSQDVVSVTLREGWNDLLLKVMNDGGGWTASARFRTADGGRLEGVYVQRGFAP
ncbi:MAG: hypothetical protein FLDDKLPJ_00588 [Phycisphaerae bacterium]|nr:hypothetical protein [Phycisphaerae bacterium]